MTRNATRFAIVGAPAGAKVDLNHIIESGLTKSQALARIADLKKGCPKSMKDLERFALAEIVVHGKAYPCQQSTAQTGKTSRAGG